MELPDDIMLLILNQSDTYVKLVARQELVVVPNVVDFSYLHKKSSKPLRTTYTDIYDAIAQVVLSEDLMTLRFLCKRATTDHELCRTLWCMLCYSIDCDKTRSFAYMLSHLPTCHMFWRSALLHAVSQERLEFLQALTNKICFSTEDLCIAYNVATACKQQHAVDFLAPIYAGANDYCQNSGKTQSKPFRFIEQ